MEKRNFAKLAEDFVKKFGKEWCNNASINLVADAFVDYVLTYED